MTNTPARWTFSSFIHSANPNWSLCIIVSLNSCESAITSSFHDSISLHLHTFFLGFHLFLFCYALFPTKYKSCSQKECFWKKQTFQEDKDWGETCEMLLIIINQHLSGTFYVENPLQSVAYSHLLQSCEVGDCYSHFIDVGLTEWKRMAYSRTPTETDLEWAGFRTNLPSGGLYQLQMGSVPSSEKFCVSWTAIDVRPTFFRHVQQMAKLGPLDLFLCCTCIQRNEIQSSVAGCLNTWCEYFCVCAAHQVLAGLFWAVSSETMFLNTQKQESWRRPRVLV